MTQARDQTCALPIGITADDLTGAADTAAALARPARPVAVALSARPPEVRGRAAVAVTTDSRPCPAAQTRQLVAASAEALRQSGCRLLYVKVDSNARGEIGAALAAAAQAWGRPVVLAPAFPARGRTTMGGVVFVHGRPVAETEMARDPEAPVTESDLVRLLRRQQRDLPVALCPLSVVRSGADGVRHATPSEGVLVADAETDADLDAVAEAALAMHPPPVLAGSAGLAAALGRRLLGPAGGPAWSGPAMRPVLALLASSSSVMQSQVAAACPPATLVPLPCQRLTRDEAPIPELRRAMQEVIVGLEAGRDVVVHAVGPLPPVERPVELVVEHLAHLAFVVMKQVRPRGLLVGGGSTAQAVLASLGAEAVEVDDEPLPGIAGGALVGGEFTGLPAALKPGAAGPPEAVAVLLDYLGRRAGEVGG